MKKLIFKAVLLVLPFALILGFIEYRLRQIPNSYSTSKAALESRLDKIEVLVTGTSHAQNGVLTQSIKTPTFNLGHGSQSLYYDTQLVSKYAERMPNLKLVVFVISYHSLEYRLSNSIERWRAGFYRQVYGIAGEDARQGFQLTDYSYIALYTPKEAYRQVLNHAPGIGVAQASEDAVATPEAIGSPSADFGLKRVKFHESEMHERDIARNVAALESACSMLSARNITVVFVTLPVHHTYSDYIQPANYQRMQQTIAELTAKYHIEYFNYFFDRRFTDEDFANSDHLNVRGADKFSRILEDEVIKRYVPK